MRRLGLTLLFSMMGAILVAQDASAPKQEVGDKKADSKKKDDDLPPIKELEKKERTREPARDDDPERIKKIIERLNKNMYSSEERLGKKDPGEDTRKIQDDIIRDLDELIKQQGKGGGGGGGGGGGAGGGGGSAGGGQSGSGGSAGSRSVTKRGSRSKGNGQAKQDKNSADKPGKSDGNKEGQSAQGTPGKNGPGGGMAGKPQANDPKEKNTIADLFKDVWGHLPQNKRQEMDAYAKERFLRKYEEILRQYYRTISEQGRRKDGE
jgi:hypothetical protein